MYIAMQDQYYTFTHFDAEAWAARDYVLGRLKLPTKKEMRADIDEWIKRQGQCDNAYDEIDFQANHLRDLMQMTDYPDFDVQKTVDQWKEWEHDKDESIVGYRNKSFVSPVTNSPAPAMATPWLQKMDDSMQSFMTDIASAQTQPA
jgi:trimethylamine monooxygenase